MAESAGNGRGGQDWRPVPDPTALTTEAVAREREYVLAVVNGAINTMNARLDAMDKAMVLLADEASKTPTKVEIAVAALRELHESKFKGIDTRFADLSDRMKEAQAERQKAIDAAVSSVRDTSAETKANFQKQMEQLQTLMQTSNQSLNEKVAEVKERQAEGVGARQLMLLGFGVIAAAASVIAIVSQTG